MKIFRKIKEWVFCRGCSFYNHHCPTHDAIRFVTKKIISRELLSRTNSPALIEDTKNSLRRELVLSLMDEVKITEEENPNIYARNFRGEIFIMKLKAVK